MNMPRPRVFFVFYIFVPDTGGKRKLNFVTTFLIAYRNLKVNLSITVLTLFAVKY